MEGIPPSSDTTSPMDLENFLANPAKRRRVDRDAYPAASSAMVTRNPMQRRKGKLMRLTNLPLDILFEVFGHLHPLDLLRLARSWRAMRTFLTSQNAKWIWGKALSSVEGLPDCPPTMSEPQFANLMFSPHCHYCGAEPVHTIVWLTRNRVCRRCFPKYFQQAKYLRDDVIFFNLPEECWKFAQLTGKVIHNASFAPITSRDTCRAIVSVVSLRKLSEEHAMVAAKPPDLEEWLKKTRQDHEAWAEIATTLANWQDDQAQQRRLELDAARQRRLDAVVRNLNAAGWEQDIKRIDLDLLRKHKLVRVPKDLTDRVWAKIKPQLTDFMEHVRSTNHEEYRLEQITRRRRLFAQYITSFHPRYAIPAPISELSQFDSIRSIIEDAPVDQVITFDSFPPPHVIMQMFLCWHRRKKHSLLKIMQQSPLMPLLVTVAHLNLATTFFCCSGPGLREPIGQLDVLIHSATYSRRGVRKQSSEFFTRLFQDFHQEFWNFGEDRVSFHESAFLAARDIVAACGYDPDTTSAASMDGMFCLMECVSCRDFWNGRLVMPWRRAVIHAMDHMGVSSVQLPPPQWKVVDAADPFYATAVAQITAQVPTFRCHICHIDGVADFITNHIKETHVLSQTVTLLRQPHSAFRIPYY